MTLKDFIQHPAALSPVEAMVQSQRAGELDSILGVLSPREDLIVRLRFGVGVDGEHTLAQIGERLGLSRERVRLLNIDIKTKDCYNLSWSKKPDAYCSGLF